MKRRRITKYIIVVLAALFWWAICQADAGTITLGLALLIAIPALIIGTLLAWRRGLLG